MAEHWFDTLSRPHTRRTTLKGAALAVAAAVALPALRPRTAAAATTLPCFRDCVEEATGKWADRRDVCKRIGEVSRASLLTWVYNPVGPPLLMSILGNAQAADCYSDANATWARGMANCREPECGDRSKYPGGNAPRVLPKCDPKEEIACGDTCCYTFNKCCPNPNAPGGYSCWAAHHVC